MNISRERIIDFFNLLNDSGIRYVLLRNIDDELPDNITDEKDIDVLVNIDDRDRFRKLIKRNKWIQVRHPWDFGDNFVFLYAMQPLEFYENKGIHLDVCYQLCCRSINKGEWMPLDKAINFSVWENRKKDPFYNWFVLADDDLFIHLLTRCVFDKRVFKDGYIKKILELYGCIDIVDVKNKLRLVFFAFTDRLLELVAKGEFCSICREYETYKDY